VTLQLSMNLIQKALKSMASIVSDPLFTRLTMSRTKPQAVLESSKKIAERIVRMRKERGITQIQLAETLGVTQPMISRLERGDYRFTDETLVAIAKLYKVSADEILGLKSTDEANPFVSRRWLPQSFWNDLVLAYL
jgi:ribosome-binding protein aMBF1 (putative translation factor)